MQFARRHSTARTAGVQLPWCGGSAHVVPAEQALVKPCHDQQLLKMNLLMLHIVTAQSEMQLSSQRMEQDMHAAAGRYYCAALQCSAAQLMCLAIKFAG